MRHLLLLLAFFAGGALILWGFNIRGRGDPMWPLWVAAGLTVFIGMIVSIRRRGRQMRKDLLAGKDVIARWQVSPADLEAFRALDRERVAVSRRFRNCLRFPKKVPPEGFPIIIGHRSWLIGTRLYPYGSSSGGLPAGVATLEGDPGYIEVALIAPVRLAGYILGLLRLPVPIDARAAARAAAAALAGHVEPSNRKLLLHFFPDYARDAGIG